MAAQDNIEHLEQKRICFRCVSEQFLQAEIRRKGVKAPCDYCGRALRGYSIRDMAERIEEVFEHFYVRTSDQPTDFEQMLMSDRESTYEWEREGDIVTDAIADVAQIPAEAANDIQSILDDKYAESHHDYTGEETEFSGESYYERKSVSDDVWRREWLACQQSLKTEARFFSRTAAAHFADVFCGIDKIGTSDGTPLVIEIGPGTAITKVYRARVFQSEAKLQHALCYPDRELGPPAMEHATAGRMNARGIAVFYGSNDPSVAVAEVRPPVGSRVAVACFDIVRSLRVLDLTALSRVKEGGSMFDRSIARRLGRAAFLRSLSAQMTKPVMPDDETFEYLSTQAIADFLATENDPSLDGIIFRSAQASGNALNFVFFHKAARVERIEVPPNTVLSAGRGSGDPDDDDDHYWVYAIKKPQPSRTKELWPHLFHLGNDVWLESDPDKRAIALKIDATSIVVHEIAAVRFDTEERRVSREPFDAPEPDF